jgi:uncharacterized membrane protein YgcG
MAISISGVLLMGLASTAHADGMSTEPSASSSETTQAEQIDASYVVFDKANVLTTETKDWLVRENQSLQSTENKPVVAVYTENSLPDGANIDTYRTQVFNDLKIGGRDRNNGVLVLVFPQ